MNISLRKANVWFSVLWLIWILDYVDRMAVNAVLPILKDEFLFSDSQLGLISSIVGASISILAPFAAILADKWSRRKLIGIMVALWSAATFATGMATGYVSLILARLGVGVGEAGYAPAGTALISVWYPKKNRGTMMGLWFSGTSIGMVMGVVLAGLLAHKYGWRSCFGILAVPGIVFAILAWFLPDYKAVKVKQAEDRDEKKGVSVCDALRYIAKSPSIIILYLSFAAVAFTQMSLATWAVSLFVRSFEMNIKQASMVVGLCSLVGFLGTPLVGWMADKLMTRTNKGRLIAAALFFGINALILTLFFQMFLPMKNIYLAGSFFGLAYFFSSGVLANLHTTVQDIVSHSFRSIAAGFIPLVAQVFGAIPGPIVAGIISDSFGLVFALQSVVIISTTALFLYMFLVSRFYDRDIEKARALGTFTLQKG